MASDGFHELLVGACEHFYRVAVSNKGATGHMWLNSNNKLKIQFFLRSSHSLSAQWPHVAHEYCIRTDIEHFHHGRQPGDSSILEHKVWLLCSS